MSSIDLLKKYSITLKKSLGQNLLLDPNINRKMVEIAAVGPDDSVFEVGTGAGDLTSELARKAAAVLTVEIDAGFEPLLHERLRDMPNVRVFIGDVLNHTVEELLTDFLPDAQHLKMVSNLPYYITSPVLMHFLESKTRFVSLTVMVQREVAERIVATPGGKDYGPLTIACQLYSRPYIAHIVSPNCFRPRPKVESAIVHLSLRDDFVLDTGERRTFFAIVHAAFGQRRKKIVNALGPLCGSLLPAKNDLPEFLSRNGIRPDSRAETVPVEHFVRLTMDATRARPSHE